VEELDNDLPPYILRGSPAEPIWISQNLNGWKKQPRYDTQTLEVHLAADNGDIERLAKLAAENKRLLHFKDKNGWQPIHEAARAGHRDVVEFLVGKGVDINARAHDGEGDTPLDLAINALGSDHPVSQYLLSLGARGYRREL
jgi:ankyrin repeat protein